MQTKVTAGYTDIVPDLGRAGRATDRDGLPKLMVRIGWSGVRGPASSSNSEAQRHVPIGQPVKAVIREGGWGPCDIACAQTVRPDEGDRISDAVWWVGVPDNAPARTDSQPKIVVTLTSLPRSATISHGYTDNCSARSARL